MEKKLKLKRFYERSTYLKKKKKKKGKRGR